MKRRYARCFWWSIPDPSRRERSRSALTFKRRLRPSAAQGCADGVDWDKHTNLSCTPEPQHESPGGPEFESLHSGRDRPAIRGLAVRIRHPGRPECARKALSCLDVYGPRPIAIDFSELRFKVTTADIRLRYALDRSSPLATMDFRALPPQCRQSIGRIHASPDIIYEGEVLDLLVQRRRDKASHAATPKRSSAQARDWIWTLARPAPAALARCLPGCSPRRLKAIAH